MNKKLLTFSVLFIATFYTHLAFADFLPENQKQVGGYIKFQGWENVSNYMLMQLMNSPESCDHTYVMPLVLLNDGERYSFGFYSHGNEYYGLIAINKSYISDIGLAEKHIVDESKNEKDTNIYMISCESEGYKTALFTNTVIPHGDNVLTKTDPIKREDFIVTIKGIDVPAKKLNIVVSDPIIRKSLDDPSAKAFVDSLIHYQKLDQKTATCQQELSTCSLNLSNTLKSISISKPTPNAVNNQAEIKTTDQTWGIFALVSGSLITGLFGFLVGRIVGKRTKHE